MTAGGAAMVAPSPTAFTPSGFVRHGVHSKAEVDLRHEHRARYAVVAEGAGQELPALAVVDVVLDKCLAESLGQAPVRLALGDHRVDDDAEVFDDRVLGRW